MRDQLYDRANSVLSLEERRLLLDTAMKERRQEIRIHTDMLRAQIKTAEEERSKIRSALIAYSPFCVRCLAAIVEGAGACSRSLHLAIIYYITLCLPVRFYVNKLP